MIYTPAPNFINLTCRICHASKKQLDGNDDVTISEDWNVAKGTWFCPNGHANTI
jgi:hypothetical protein